MTDGREMGPCLSQFQVDLVVRHRMWNHPVNGVILEHSGQCERCAQVVEGALKEERRFASSVLPAALPGLRAAAAVRRPGSPWAWVVIGASIALVLALLVVAGRWWFARAGWGPTQARTVALRATGSDVPSQLVPPSLHPAGVEATATLRLQVIRDGRTSPFRPDLELREGDLLRVEPLAVGFEYLLLLHEDARGEFRVVFPWTGLASGALPPRGEALARTLVMDDKPGPERLIGLVSHESLAASSARLWLEGRAGQVTPGPRRLAGRHVEVVVVRLGKESP